MSRTSSVTSWARWVVLFGAIVAVASHTLARPESGRSGLRFGQLEAVPPAQSEARFHGEYGLWVSEDNGRIAVKWITLQPDSGYLKVIADDELLVEFTTPRAASHAVAFARPRSRRVILRYGGLGNPRDAHETTLHLDTVQQRESVFEKVDSIFVVGDLHGQYDRFVELLRNANVVDPDLRWAAGRSHLVLLGDLVDRGPDVTRLLWFLYDLEKQAERSRGRLHIVLGNHEIMVMTADLRYVAPKEARIAELHGTSYSRMFDPRHSVLGKWLASKPALLRIDGVLFAHGGVSRDYLGYRVETYNDSLWSFMSEPLFYRWADSTVAVRIDSASLARRIAFFFTDRSLFWYRGYVESDTLGDALAHVLRRFKSDLHVVAHTAVETIQERYQGSLLAVHPREPAAEMLLLVRSGRGHRRYRYKLEGPPEPL